MTRTTQTVRWGVLGTASIDTKLSRAIRRAEGAELLGIASRSLERAEEWASTHKAGRAYGSYADMIGDPEIDAVYMPLPPSMHLEWTTKAAEVRKHVLCEKPPTMNAEETRAMAAVCACHGVQFMDGVMWVHHRRAEAMARVIADGAIGEP